MYIIKNALRCISRAKGRNILIGIIALVISISACIGLSIQQASIDAMNNALAGMSVTGSISYDRANAMNQIGGFGGGQRPDSGERPSFDKGQFAEMMGGASSLTLEEYEIYAKAESVSDFYYTLTAYFDGSDNLLPVTDEVEEDEDENEEQGGFNPNDFMGGGFGGMMGGGMFSSGEFTIVGYSSDSALTDFVETTTITEGSLFEEATTEYTCVISEELALFNNNLAVGDTITITNPNLESETYTLTITGIYSSSENNDFDMNMFGSSQDPVNKIYMSAQALQIILDASEENSTTVTDENDRETQSAVTGSLNATYVFADTDAYYAFEEEVRELGLDDSYTVSSSDIKAYQNSLTPLNTLSTMAGWFLVVILIIGGIILVVLNIFNVRERKYEVGVLTAMGMKKWKVALQFVCEILIVTMLAVIIGAGVGAVSSVPVTNALLEGQTQSQTNQQNQWEENIGRPGNMPGGNFGGGFGGGMPSDIPDDMGGGKNPFENMFNGAVEYITEVDSAMNLTVVFQMLGVGLLLTLVASAASVLFIMRYDPLKILANRD